MAPLLREATVLAPLLREVTVLDRADGMVVVGEGLEEDELVVVDGAYDLQEGSKVRVVDSRGEAGGH